MQKARTKEEYWEILKDLKKKTFWSTTDLMQALQVSKQRVHQMADIYNWDPIYETPRVWEKGTVVRDLAEILEKRKEVGKKVLVSSGLMLFAEFTKEDIKKTVGIFEDHNLPAP